MVQVKFSTMEYKWGLKKGQWWELWTYHLSAHEFGTQHACDTQIVMADSLGVCILWGLHPSVAEMRAVR